MLDRPLAPARHMDVPIGSKNAIPQHRILSVVTLRNAVMNIMRLGVKDVDASDAESDVEPRVVQTGDDAANGQEQQACHHMNSDKEAAAEKQGQEMIVFTQKVLKGVDVDGVYVAATRSQLSMVMLVDVAVNGLDVERPVKDGIEEIVDYE